MPIQRSLVVNMIIPCLLFTFPISASIDAPATLKGLFISEAKVNIYSAIPNTCQGKFNEDVLEYWMNKQLNDYGIIDTSSAKPNKNNPPVLEATIHCLAPDKGESTYSYMLEIEVFSPVYKNNIIDTKNYTLTKVVYFHELDHGYGSRKEVSKFVEEHFKLFINQFIKMWVGYNKDHKNK